MISRRLRMASVVLSVCVSPIATSALAGAAHASPQTLLSFQGSLQAQTQRVDPVADLARRLLALGVAGRSNVTSSVVVSGSSGSLPSPVVSSGQSSTQVSTTPVSSVPSQGALPTAPSEGQSWSATVVETGAISRFQSAGPTPVVPVGAAADASAGATQTDRDQLISLLASEVASRAKVDAVVLAAVWRRADERRMRAVLTALAQVGTPYRAAGNQPGGFDCSGLTSYAWAQAGVKIPRSSGDQINAMAPRTFEQAQPGDLIWHPGHIGMYLGAGDAMVHSPQSGKTVEVRKISRGIRYGSPLASS